MDRRLVKPVAGRIVRDPDHGGNPLPEAGTVVDWSTYWHRRLEDGDITATAAPEAKGPASASADKPLTTRVERGAKGPDA
jgi:hypothetical protein